MTNKKKLAFCNQKEKFYYCVEFHQNLIGYVTNVISLDHLTWNDLIVTAREKNRRRDRNKAGREKLYLLYYQIYYCSQTPRLSASLSCVSRDYYFRFIVFPLLFLALILFALAYEHIM